MSNFMKMIESYSGGAALGLLGSYDGGVGTAQLFAGDGVPVRIAINRTQTKAYQAAWKRFNEAYGNMLAGHRASHRFVRALIEGEPAAFQMLVQGIPSTSYPGQPMMMREAISTSDFPLLFGDTIDRLLLAKYQAYPATWQDYMKVSRVQDFRDVKRFKCSPGRGLLPSVTQGESYKSDKPSESHYSFAVGKYGSVRNIFWEALVNDDLGALQDTPNDLAFQAAQTEWWVATGLFAANTTLYATNHAAGGSTYSNKGTAQFSAEALADAISTMADYPGDDDDGTPIMNEPLYIVVGSRKLEMEANQVLNSLIVAYTGASDTGNLPTANIIPAELRNKMQVRYNPFIRLHDSTNYVTSWYLFAEPMMGWAAEFAYLSGYDAPQLFMRASSQMMLGGGLASPMEGGFDNDAVDYKVRHVMGGSHTNAVGGWRFSYWSDGTV